MSMILAIGGCLHPIHVVQPSSTLTSSLVSPASWTVGTAVSFTVTATLANGATGPVTIGATGLPAGVALGATTDNGDGTYTATGAGTPTTAQAASDVTFSTSGGSVAAAPLVVSIAVQAASTGVTVVGAYTNTATGYGALSVTVPDVQAGDNLVVFAVSTSGSGVTTSTASDSAGNAYTALPAPTVTISSGARGFLAKATAAAASLTVTVAQAPTPSNRKIVACLVRGGVLTNDAANNQLGLSQAPSTNPFAPTGLAIGGAGVAFAIGAYTTNNSAASASNASGMTLDLGATATGYGNQFVAHATYATAQSAIPVSFSNTGSVPAAWSAAWYPFTAA